MMREVTSHKMFLRDGCVYMLELQSNYTKFLFRAIIPIEKVTDTLGKA